MRKMLGIGEGIRRKLKRHEAPPIAGRNGAVRDNRARWRLTELEDAFCFYVGAPERPDNELFIEHDEMTAAGAAYAEQSPLSIKDVLERLEMEEPGFADVMLSPDLILVRKRLPRSSGLLLRVSNVATNFFSDKTLNSINFLDFYEDMLKPMLKPYSRADVDDREQLLREFNYGETIIN